MFYKCCILYISERRYIPDIQRFINNNYYCNVKQVCQCVVYQIDNSHFTISVDITIVNCDKGQLCGVMHLKDFV